MFNKLSLFLSAIAIGILSIFSGISTKNTAEPQYFLENTQVKNAIVETNTNVYTFYLDINVNYYQPIEEMQPILLCDYALEFYYIKKDTTTFIEYDLDSYLHEFYGEYSETTLYFDAGSQQNVFILMGEDIEEHLVEKTLNNNWHLNFPLLQDEVIAFKIVGSHLINTIEETDTILNSYIGNLTSLPTDEPIPPLEQINTLVSDIVNWFTNIFNGLGNVFYDPTANKLTAWGTVMFIGVAIMLISMALKWVISLIRGV